METSSSAGNPYQAPEALLPAASVSPRLRFWSAAFAWLFAAPVTALALALAPKWPMVVLLGVAGFWAASVAWMLRGYKQPDARLGFGRAALVALGFTMVLGISFVLGAAITSALFMAFLQQPIEIELPRTSS
jgi:hypothetical protein